MNSAEGLKKIGELCPLFQTQLLYRSLQVTEILGSICDDLSELSLCFFHLTHEVSIRSCCLSMSFQAHVIQTLIEPFIAPVSKLEQGLLSDRLLVIKPLIV